MIEHLRRADSSIACACFIAVVWLSATRAPGNQPLNVLFIAVDDLRPQLDCYGQDEMLTPSLDRLRKRDVASIATMCKCRLAAHRAVQC